jgi:hypothetical protein
VLSVGCLWLVVGVSVSRIGGCGWLAFLLWCKMQNENFERERFLEMVR